MSVRNAANRLSGLHSTRLRTMDESGDPDLSKNLQKIKHGRKCFEILE